MTRIMIKCERCTCDMGQIDGDAVIDGKPIKQTTILCVNCSDLSKVSILETMELTPGKVCPSCKSESTRKSIYGRYCEICNHAWKVE